MTDQPATATTSTLLLSVEDAASELCISRTTLYQLLEAGSIRSMKVGSRRLIVRESVERFIEIQVESSFGSGAES